MTALQDIEVRWYAAGGYTLWGDVTFYETTPDLEAWTVLLVVGRDQRPHVLYWSDRLLAIDQAETLLWAVERIQRLEELGPDADPWQLTDQGNLQILGPAPAPS